MLKILAQSSAWLCLLLASSLSSLLNTFASLDKREIRVHFLTPWNRMAECSCLPLGAGLFKYAPDYLL
jgi:hypothetical protein